MIELKYPVILTEDDNGSVIAEFIDIPEAITCGLTEELALKFAKDALLIILEDYIDQGRSIPVPSKFNEWHPTVSIFLI
jgi:antitoxin HicB